MLENVLNVETARVDVGLFWARERHTTQQARCFLQSPIKLDINSNEGSSCTFLVVLNCVRVRVRAARLYRKKHRVVLHLGLR